MARDEAMGASIPSTLHAVARWSLHARAPIYIWKSVSPDVTHVISFLLFSPHATESIDTIDYVNVYVGYSIYAER